jgi:hypothetical protein
VAPPPRRGDEETRGGRRERGIAEVAELRLPVKMVPQPDGTTCGPTCLHAIYRYWGDDNALPDVVARTRRLARGGTVAVFLAPDALRKGYRATIYTYNLPVFDPTWFAQDVDLAAKLERQRKAKRSTRLGHITEDYLEFLSLGGRPRFVDLSRSLIRGLLRRRLPIIAGLSATYLYRAAREFGPHDRPDDVGACPADTSSSSPATTARRAPC